MVRLLSGYRPSYPVKLSNEIKEYWHYRRQRYWRHHFLNNRSSCPCCSTTPKKATFGTCTTMDRQRCSICCFISYVVLNAVFFFLQFKLKTSFGSRWEIASIHPTVEPFRETNPAPASTHKPTLSTASSSTSPSSTTSPISNFRISNPASRKGQGDLTVLPSSSNAQLEPAVQHVDSGVRVANLDPIQLSSARVELPPVYSPV